MEPELSGEFFIPGKYPKRIEDEHVERYHFAAQFVHGKHTLDIACGAGYGTYMLSQAGAAHVDGVDIGDAMIAYAQSHYAAPNITFYNGSITDFGQEATYDVVTSFETIEHVEDYSAALKNLYRALRPGGTLIISTPNRPMSWRPVKSLHDKPRNPFHVREFNLSEFTDIVRQHGFELKPENILGQRQFIYIPNRYLRKVYMMIFNPEDRSSPVVKPLKSGTQPKYIVLVCRKAL